jgi:HKD family nuclease
MQHIALQMLMQSVKAKERNGMKLVLNTGEKPHHLGELESLFNEATSAILMSPFLSEDLAGLLGNFKLSNLKALRLITTLKPNTREQLKKIDALISLFDLVEDLENVKLQVSINNKLHGKVYIFYREELPIGALITSANLTESGLNRNHEWGVLLKDSQIIETVATSIHSAADYTELSHENAVKLHQVAAEYRDKHSEPPNDGKTDLDLTALLREMNLEFEIDENTRIWLKPLGLASDQIAEDADYSMETHNIHFSRRRPSGVRIGDFIVAYAVGSGKILSCFSAQSEPTRLPDEKVTTDWENRWPWFITCKNESMTFGKEWWMSNLVIGELLRNYLALPNQEAPVTAAGGITLGTLNYGADKVWLSKEFGSYLITQIRKSEQKP